MKKFRFFKKQKDNQKLQREIITVTDYAIIALQDRFSYHKPINNNVAFTAARGIDICRIIHSCDETMISVKKNLTDKLKTYLNTIDLNEAIQKPTFYND